jgi:hypothetical protein
VIGDPPSPFTRRVLAVAGLSLVPWLLPPARAEMPPMCDSPPCSRAELERYERRVVRHLLRAQQARFEADARGDAKQALRRAREFERTRERRQAVRDAIENP